MPHYFFHIDAARHYVETDGVGLADIATARMEALRIIRELLIHNTMDNLRSGSEWIMTIAIRAACYLFSIRLLTPLRTGARIDQAVPLAIVARDARDCCAHHMPVRLSRDTPCPVFGRISLGQRLLWRFLLPPLNDRIGREAERLVLREMAFRQDVVWP